MGKPITVITPAEKLAEQREVVAGLGRGESVRHFETVRKRKNGERIDVSRLCRRSWIRAAISVALLKLYAISAVRNSHGVSAQIS